MTAEQTGAKGAPGPDEPKDKKPKVTQSPTALLNLFMTTLGDFQRDIIKRLTDYSNNQKAVASELEGLANALRLRFPTPTKHTQIGAEQLVCDWSVADPVPTQNSYGYANTFPTVTIERQRVKPDVFLVEITQRADTLNQLGLLPVLVFNRGSGCLELWSREIVNQSK